MFGFLYLVAVVALISVWAMSLQRRRAEASELRRSSEELATKFQTLLILMEGLAKDKTSGGESQPMTPGSIHGSGTSIHKVDPAFEQAVVFYESHLEELVSKHEGQYIAILDGQVQDHDDDFARLAQRVYAKFGYRDIFMPKVARELPRVRFPSPRIVTQPGR